MSIVLHRLLPNKSQAGSISTIGSTGVGFKFHCEEDRGAVLLLQDGAKREEAHCDSAFRQYMHLHHHSWLSFANETYGLSLQPEDVLLVRGCVKTTEWALAAFLDKGKMLQVAFQAQVGHLANVNFSVEQSERASTSVEHRSGPPNISKLSGSAALQSDQSVFVSVYKLKRRLFRGLKIVAAAEPPETGGGSPDSSIVQFPEEPTVPFPETI